MSLLWTTAALSLLLPARRTPAPLHRRRRCGAPLAIDYGPSNEWMNRLGQATNSKKKWALPMDADTLGVGSVVMANAGSFDHYFLESLVLVIEHSEDGTRGVLLNHETPWKVEDLSPGAIAPFAANTVFLGGDAGRDTMMMVHGESELPGAKEVGRGIYQGGTEVRAVEAAAIPAERFKFFYKTVEWLPNALRLQIDAGIFRLVELSPGWLYGQSGQRSMWKQVLEEVGEEEQEAASAADGALAPGEAAGLPYEQAAGGAAEELLRRAEQQAAAEGAAGGAAEGGPAGEARRGAAAMRAARDGQRAATDAVRKEDAARTEAARLSHDEKVKAYVAQIKAEKAAKAAAAPGGAAEAPPPPPPPPPVPDVAAAAMAAAAVPSAAPPAAAGAQAAQAAAWLAERGIVAPRPKAPAPAASPAPPGAAADAPADAAAPAAAPAAAAAEAEGGETSTAGVEGLVGYRRHLGNEQWRVRWRGEGEAADTWEAWRVLDTRALRESAEALRAEVEAA